MLRKEEWTGSSSYADAHTMMQIVFILPKTVSCVEALFFNDTGYLPLAKRGKRIIPFHSGRQDTGDTPSDRGRHTRQAGRPP